MARTPLGLCALGLGQLPDTFVETLLAVPGRQVAHADDCMPDARQQLGEYFRGQRRDFEIPLDMSAGTPFQQAVWRALTRIPYGETRSYLWAAAQAGCPRGVRAVGQANGANPIPVIVPCHRVIRSDGTIGGYSMGLPIKRSLLALETGAAIATWTRPCARSLLSGQKFGGP